MTGTTVHVFCLELNMNYRMTHNCTHLFPLWSRTDGGHLGHYFTSLFRDGSDISGIIRVLNVEIQVFRPYKQRFVLLLNSEFRHASDYTGRQPARWKARQTDRRTDGRTDIHTVFVSTSMHFVPA